MKYTYKNTTVRNYVREVLSNYNLYCRPDIQRNLVWGREDHEKLFNTVAHGGGINTKFLLWKAALNIIPQYRLPNKLDTTSTSWARVEDPNHPEREVLSILDGLQKTTSFLSTFSEEGSVDGKVLCANLGRKYKDIVNDVFDTKFIDEDDIPSVNSKMTNGYYVRASEIFYSNSLINDYEVCNSRTHEENSEIVKNIVENFNYIYNNISNEENISLAILDSATLSQAYREFVNANTSGKTLSREDLIIGLISMKIPGFREYLEKIRREVVGSYKKDKKIYSAGSSYGVKVDKILNCILCMANLPFGVTHENVYGTDIAYIHRMLPLMGESIISVFRDMSALSLTKEVCAEFDAVIPQIVSRFLRFERDGMSSSISKRERDELTMYSQYMGLISMFNGHTTNTVNSLNSLLRLEHDFICDNGITMEFLKEKWTFRDKALGHGMCNSFDTYVEILKGISYTNPNKVRSVFGLLLTILSSSNKFYWGPSTHIDHLHPRIQFTKASSEESLVSMGMDRNTARRMIEEKIYDRIGNLEILDQYMNITKKDTPFKEWYDSLDDSRKALVREFGFLPEGVSLELKDMETLVIERERAMARILASYF